MVALICSLISLFFSSLKCLTVTLKNKNYAVITYGKTLGVISPKYQDWMHFCKHWLLTSTVHSLSNCGLNIRYLLI